MRIVNICTCYNEIEYLPYVVNYYKGHGIEIFVLDNYSSDGSWEYLQEKKIPCERIDTGGAFHMDVLQAARLKKMHELKPDWVIYGDADEFIVGRSAALPALIHEVDKAGFNVIKCRKLEFYYTGEKRVKTHPKNVYFYYDESYLLGGGVTRIHKYHPDVHYKGDAILLPPEQEKLCAIHGYILNYGGTKTKEAREEIYERTKKAWALGMHPRLSSHYEEYHKRGWIWSKDELSDIRAYEPLRQFLAE